MPYKGGVQLLPETQRRPTLASYTSGNSYFYAAVVIIIGVLALGAVISSYSYSLKDKIATIDGQMGESEKARTKEIEQELVAASRQSKIMKQLLAGKMYWTQALDMMERMTQSSVSLTRLEANATKGTISFRASADSYASVARQIAAFVSVTGVDDITVKSIKANARGRVEFDGELLIDALKLLKKTEPTK